MEDAWDWLSKLFEPLLAQLTPSSTVFSMDRRPVHSQYLFTQHFYCVIDVTNEPRAYRLYLGPLLIQPCHRCGRRISYWSQSTQSRHPFNINIIHDYPEDALMNRPTKILIDGGDNGRYLFLWAFWTLAQISTF